MASASSPSTDDGLRRRAQLSVMVGLFVSFGALIGYALQVPSAPGNLATIVPWLAIGFLTAWTGGILFGNALIEPPRGVPPALKGQLGLGIVGTLAGALASAVVVHQTGPWSSPSPGTPGELVTAIAAVVLAWAGGFLLGHSTQRFVRRRRRKEGPSLP